MSIFDVDARRDYENHQVRLSRVYARTFAYLRGETGRTQTQFAPLAHMSAQTLARIEKGRTAASLEQQFAIEDALRQCGVIKGWGMPMRIAEAVAAELKRLGAAVRVLSDWYDVPVLDDRKIDRVVAFVAGQAMLHGTVPERRAPSRPDRTAENEAEFGWWDYGDDD